MFKVKSRLFFAFLSSSFVFMPKVQADLFGDYVSSQTQEVEQRRTVGSGSRSNCKSSIAENSVSLLVPEQEIVHHTTLEKPSFFLSANKVSSTKPFKFTLVNPRTATTLVEKSFSVSEGIQQIELPKSTRLKLGEVYLWYVAIPCTNNSNDYREVLGAAIKRSKPSQNVEAQLRRAKSNLDTAAIYARNGFWYEALEIAVKEQNREQKGDRQANDSSFLDQLLISAEANSLEQAELR